jgi:hypothetical protein
LEANARLPVVRLPEWWDEGNPSTSGGLEGEGYEWTNKSSSHPLSKHMALIGRKIEEQVKF